MIDREAGRKSQENFLHAFGEPADCLAEKLHMDGGWLGLSGVLRWVDGWVGGWVGGWGGD